MITDVDLMHSPPWLRPLLRAWAFIAWNWPVLMTRGRRLELESTERVHREICRNK